MRLIAPRSWESVNWLVVLLLPLALLYSVIISIRKIAYRLHLFSCTNLPVPLIIVGNIRIGGTGKTPLVIALAKALQKAGFQPGVIARGYLSTSEQSGISRQVLLGDLASAVGDEPALMAMQLSQHKIPVWIGKKRGPAALSLLNAFPQCNVVICDDGLQHYALGRQPARNGGHDIEMIVQDERANGNGFLLPAGPLREPRSRDRDLTIQMHIHEGPIKRHNDSLQPFDGAKQRYQAQAIHATMGNAYPLSFIEKITLDSEDIVSPKSQPLHALARSFLGMYGEKLQVVALAGIAYPEKFFNPLRQIFPHLQTQHFPDHEDFTTNPFWQFPTKTHQLVLITEKDAVKCRKWSDERVWVVPLEATIPDDIVHWMACVLRR